MWRRISTVVLEYLLRATKRGLQDAILLVVVELHPNYRADLVLVEYGPDRASMSWGKCRSVNSAMIDVIL